MRTGKLGRDCFAQRQQDRFQDNLEVCDCGQSIRTGAAESPSLYAVIGHLFFPGFGNIASPITCCRFSCIIRFLFLFRRLERDGSPLQPGCTLRTLIAQSLVSFQVASFIIDPSMAELKKCHFRLDIGFFSLSQALARLVWVLMRRHLVSQYDHGSCISPYLGT